MSEYLTKEEIRRWRSSLERITLEEYAARLGKAIQGEKHDDSLVDSVTLTALNSVNDEAYVPKAEKLQVPPAKIFMKEKEMKHEKPAAPEIKETAPKAKETVSAAKEEKPRKNIKKPKMAKDDFSCSFKKILTPREQLVFDHFAAHKNTIVYAKDLAKVLGLPRDYVYKYIKNLRSKLIEDILLNADNGGYMLKV